MVLLTAITLSIFGQNQQAEPFFEKRVKELYNKKISKSISIKGLNNLELVTIGLKLQVQVQSFVFDKDINLHPGPIPWHFLRGLDNCIVTTPKLDKGFSYINL